MDSKNIIRIGVLRESLYLYIFACPSSMAGSVTVKMVAEKSLDVINKTIIKICQNKKPVSNVFATLILSTTLGNYVTC